MTEQMMIDLMLANQAEKYEKQLAELRAENAEMRMKLSIIRAESSAVLAKYPKEKK